MNGQIKVFNQLINLVHQRKINSHWQQKRRPKRIGWMNQQKVLFKSMMRNSKNKPIKHQNQKLILMILRKIILMNRQRKVSRQPRLLKRKNWQKSKRSKRNVKRMVKHLLRRKIMMMKTTMKTKMITKMTMTMKMKIMMMFSTMKLKKI